jgi:hypothetical protein
MEHSNQHEKINIQDIATKVAQYYFDPNHERRIPGYPTSDYTSYKYLIKELIEPSNFCIDEIFYELETENRYLEIENINPYNYFSRLSDFREHLKWQHKEVLRKTIEYKPRIQELVILRQNNISQMFRLAKLFTQTPNNQMGIIEEIGKALANNSAEFYELDSELSTLRNEIYEPQDAYD